MVTLSQPGGRPASSNRRAIFERGERRRRRRLEDHGAAGGHGGSDLVADQVQREVERRDRRDHTDRDAHDVPELADAGGAGVHRDHLAGEGAGHRRGEPERVHRTFGLDPRRGDGLRRLARDRHGELVESLRQQDRGAVQDRRALVRRRRSDAVALQGDRDGAVEIVAGAGGNGTHQGAVVGGVHLADIGGEQVLAVEQCRSHVGHGTGPYRCVSRRSRRPRDGLDGRVSTMTASTMSASCSAPGGGAAALSGSGSSSSVSSSSTSTTSGAGAAATPAAAGGSRSTPSRRDRPPWPGGRCRQHRPRRRCRRG